MHTVKHNNIFFVLVATSFGHYDHNQAKFTKNVKRLLSKEKTNLMPLILLFNTHSMLNMFRPLIRPSSGVCD